MITESQVAATRPAGTKLSERRPDWGAGSLVVRWGQGDRRLWYFKYSLGRHQRMIPISPSDIGEARAKLERESVDGRKVSDLAAARRIANGYGLRAREARAREIDLRELLAQEKVREREAERARMEEAARAEREAGRGSLSAMLDAYAGYLASAGKQSASDVRTMFARHVYAPHPELAARPAAEVTPDEVAAIVRRVRDLGRGRSAAKLRAYLRAAFALAEGARLDPEAPAAMLGFGVKHNPVAATPARSLARYNRARDRVLTDGELGYYMLALERLSPAPARDAALLALLLGGQRPTQLLRATPGDVDLEARTITLRDPKGRRSEPRLHVLPLSAAAVRLLHRRLSARGAPWVFTESGKRPTSPQTCGDVAARIFAAMASDRLLREAKALGDGVAQLRDVRRTAETTLQRLGLSRDVRAQLLSHGVHGVQAKHYERHSFADEKRDALARWERHLSSLVRARQRDEKASTGKAGRARSRVLPAKGRQG